MKKLQNIYFYSQECISENSLMLNCQNKLLKKQIILKHKTKGENMI